MSALSAGVVAFEDGQQVTEVGSGSEFADQLDVSFDPVVFADHWLMRQSQSLIDVDRIGRIGDYARDVASSPVIMCHARIVPYRDKLVTDSNLRRPRAHMLWAAEVPGGRRRLPQTMNRCRYLLTVVSVSRLTLPS